MSSRLFQMQGTEDATPVSVAQILLTHVTEIPGVAPTLWSGLIQGLQQGLRALSPSPGSARCCGVSIPSQAFPPRGLPADPGLLLCGSNFSKKEKMLSLSRVPGLSLTGSDWFCVHP